MNRETGTSLQRRHRAAHIGWRVCVGITCAVYLFALVASAATTKRRVQSPRAATAESSQLSAVSKPAIFQLPTPISSVAASSSIIAPTNKPVSVDLAWDASPDHARITNYFIRYGIASAIYTNSASAGTNLTLTISNLNARVRYYFAAFATANNGLTSGPTPEIFWPAPFTNYVGVGIKTNGRVIVQLTYTNPPGDVVLFEPFIWVTNDAVSVLKLDTRGLIVGNTNTP